MKAAIVSVLPFLGLALAQDQCTKQTVTMTRTHTQTYTVTASEDQPVKVETKVVYVTGSHTPKYCGQATVTKTETQTQTRTVRRPSASKSAVVVVPSSKYDSPSTAAEPEGSSAPEQPNQPNQPNKPVSNPTSTKVETSPAPTAVAEAPEETETKPETPVPDAGAGTSGKATFYGGNLGGGMCSFTGYTLPSGLFGTAFSGAAWDSADNCGRCVSVTGPNGKTIKAMVVDQCPECESTHLDLFQDAFSQIGNIADGIIPITYSFVDCGITSPIVLKNKEGTSPHWFSMQVMNSNVPVSKLEVSTDGGSTWEATSRQPYNYFENSSGFGTDSVDVKVTSDDGQSIVVKGVSVAASSTKSGSGNFS